MTGLIKPISCSRKCLAVANAFFLLYFLAAAAPHRVHHLLAQVPSSARDTGHTHDHASPQPKQNDCVVQSIAQHAHLSSVQLVEVTFPEFAVAHNPARGVVDTSLFDASPCSQRAPPAA